MIRLLGNGNGKNFVHHGRARDGLFCPLWDVILVDRASMVFYVSRPIIEISRVLAMVFLKVKRRRSMKFG